MPYLTATAAAKRLNKSEKTIRRWIEEGRLAAFHPQGHKNRLAISEQDVERLAQEQAELEPGPAEQDIATLQGRVDALEQRVARLELAYASVTLPGYQASPSPSQSLTEPTGPAEQKPTRTRTASSSPAETPVGILPGSIQHFRFAARYGVNDRTFRDQITKGLIASTTRQKPNRPNEREYWLSPDQQRAALQFWIEHDTPHGKPLEQESSEDQEKQE